MLCLILSNTVLFQFKAVFQKASSPNMEAFKDGETIVLWVTLSVPKGTENFSWNL